MSRQKVELTVTPPVGWRNRLSVRQFDQGRLLYCRTDQQIPQQVSGTKKIPRSFRIYPESWTTKHPVISDHELQVSYSQEMANTREAVRRNQQGNMARL